MWHHAKCENIADEVYKFLSENEVSTIHWYCSKCNAVACKLVTQITKIFKRQDELEKRMDSMEISSNEQWIEVKEDMVNLEVNIK